MAIGALLDCSVPDSYRSRASYEIRKAFHLEQEGEGCVETGSWDSYYSCTQPLCSRTESGFSQGHESVPDCGMVFS